MTFYTMVGWGPSWYRTTIICCLENWLHFLPSQGRSGGINGTARMGSEAKEMAVYISSHVLPSFALFALCTGVPVAHKPSYCRYFPLVHPIPNRLTGSGLLVMLVLKVDPDMTDWSPRPRHTQFTNLQKHHVNNFSRSRNASGQWC